MKSACVALFSVFVFSWLGVFAELPGTEDSSNRRTMPQVPGISGFAPEVKVESGGHPSGFQQPLETEIISLSESSCGDLDRSRRTIVFSVRRTGRVITNTNELNWALRSTEPGEYREGLSAITRSVVNQSAERLRQAGIATVVSEQTSNKGKN